MFSRALVCMCLRAEALEVKYLMKTDTANSRMYMLLSSFYIEHFIASRKLIYIDLKYGSRRLRLCKCNKFG